MLDKLSLQQKIELLKIAKHCNDLRLKNKDNTVKISVSKLAGIIMVDWFPNKDKGDNLHFGRIVLPNYEGGQFRMRMRVFPTEQNFVFDLRFDLFQFMLQKMVEIRAGL